MWSLSFVFLSLCWLQVKRVLTVSFALCVSVCRAWLWILTFWRTVTPAARRCRSQTPGPRSMTRDVKAWTRAVSLICLSHMMHCRRALNALLVYYKSEVSVKMTGNCGLLCPLTSSVKSSQKQRKAAELRCEWNYILSLFHLICVGADSLGPNSGRW